MSLRNLDKYCKYNQLKKLSNFFLKHTNSSFKDRFNFKNGNNTIDDGISIITIASKYCSRSILDCLSKMNEVFKLNIIVKIVYDYSLKLQKSQLIFFLLLLYMVKVIFI